MASAKVKDHRYFLLGTSPTIDDIQIKTGKLPTNKQVLLSFIALKESQPNIPLHQVATDTFDKQVFPLYIKAGITTKPEKMQQEISLIYITNSERYCQFQSLEEKKESPR